MIWEEIAISYIFFSLSIAGGVLRLLSLLYYFLNFVQGQWYLFGQITPRICSPVRASWPTKGRQKIRLFFGLKKYVFSMKQDKYLYQSKFWSPPIYRCLSEMIHVSLFKLRFWVWIQPKKSKIWSNKKYINHKDWSNKKLLFVEKFILNFLLSYIL